MGFWRQFEIFDPLKSKPPYRPFPEMAGIVSRARWLLHGRTSDQIARLASDADFSIEHYFELARDQEIERLEREGNTRFCQVIANEGEVKFVFDRDKLDELEIPTADDTSEIEALKESLGGWVDLSEDEVPSAKEHEYFAAMALWFIADAIERLDYRYDQDAHQFVKRENRLLGEFDYSRIGEFVIKAMEAVCQGEHLRDIERVKDRFEDRIDRLQKALESQQIKTVDAEQAIRDEVAAKLQEEEARRKSEHAKKLSRLRHRDRDDARQAVLTAWEQNPTAFPSAEKAGNHYADWLQSQGKSFEPRTVTGWIRSHAKDKGIKFR